MATLRAGSSSAVIGAARSVLGRPYVWAGTFANGRGGDCSGLVVFAFRTGANINLPHFTGFLINQGAEVARSDLQPGDLVFPDPGHVQIYTGNGMIIEAPHTGTVVTERPMWGFWRARRILANTGATNTSSPQGFNPVGDAASAVAGLIPGLPNFQELFANSRHLMMRAIEVVLGGALILVGLSEIANPKVQQVMSSPAIKTAVKAIK